MARMRLSVVWDDPRHVVAALVLAGYVGVSFAVGNLYPFSVFDMYSRARTTASRIVARDERGQIVEVGRYESWQCDGPIDVSPAACGEPGSYFYVGYLDRERADYIAGHRGTGTSPAPVDVIRRIWWLENDSPGPPRTTDCLLQRCTAVHR
jgi:hypothetical protein